MIELLALDGNGLAARHAATVQKKLVASGALQDDAPSLPAVVPFAMLELLLKLIPLFRPQRVLVAWDSRKSWARRQAIYPDYKKARKERIKTPDDVLYKQHYIRQLRMGQTLLWALGIDQSSGEGFEADDLMAWAALRTAGKVVLVSTDKDMLPLVSERCTVYDSFTPRMYTPQNFYQEVGVPLDRFLEYLCLVGDKADGVPGIAECGDKTAKKWLQQYMTAEEMAAAVDKPKMAAANLKAGLDVVRRNRQLIDLRWVVDLPSIPMRAGRWDSATAYQICEWYRMRSTVEQWGTVESVFGTFWSTRVPTFERQYSGVFPEVQR